MNNLRLLAGLAVIGGLIMAGCAKEDGTPPYMRLKGAADTTLVLNTAFLDPGVFAKDETDGVIDNIVKVSTLNKDSVGDYTIIYKAIDAKGNESSVTRAVHVKNSLAAMQGFYNASEPCIGTADSVYSVALVPSFSKNYVFTLNQIFKYNNISLKVGASEGSDDLKIDYQTVLRNTTDTVVIAGSGTKSLNGFELNYTIIDTDSLGPHSFTCHSKYVKQ